MTKGFITLATGREEYYKLAINLLHSYWMHTSDRLPFAIVASESNQYTAEFDDVRVMDNPSNSYLDKLSLFQYLPYDINIFIDSDCLAYGDLNHLFDFFNEADDFSCFGRVLPLDDKTGWFEYENLGNLKDFVSYVVGLHGGIYYIRRTETGKSVLDSAKGLIDRYSDFKFKGKFDTPGDEPLVALSMALNNCKPIPFDWKAINCYWEYVGRMELDIANGRAFNQERQESTLVVHWGTRYTRELLYQEQVSILDILRDDKIADKDSAIQKIKQQYAFAAKKQKRNAFVKKVINKGKRIFKR